MADEVRRLRTQAERDADDTPWLRNLIGVQTADGRIYDPQEVVLIYPADGITLTEDELERLKARFAGVGQPPVTFEDQLIARHGQPMRDALDRARVRYEADKERARNPRRRWWHRYTRRTR